MQSTITGGTLPVLEFSLANGESVIAEPGEFSWMTSSIALNTTRKAAGASSWTSAIKRAFGGGGLFLTEYRADGAPGNVAFAAKLPGRIVEMDVRYGDSYSVHKHGFLCGTNDIELSAGFQQSFGAGLFGGDGFILQRIAGSGKAWIELGGEIIERTLQPGETLRVHPGHVGMFTSSVQFSIAPIPGIRNIFFGGNGIFVAKLTGPGRVWLQTLTPAQLAHTLSRYLGAETVQEQATDNVASGILGAVIRGFTK